MWSWRSGFCGVCLTGLACRDGGITDEYAVLLGHEAAGLIESAGSQARRITFGDLAVRKLTCAIRTALSV